MSRKQNKDCFVESNGSLSVSYWTDLDLDLSNQFGGLVYFSPFFACC